jgi:hypothetical protein
MMRCRPTRETLQTILQLLPDNLTVIGEEPCGIDAAIANFIELAMIRRARPGQHKDDAPIHLTRRSFLPPITSWLAARLTNLRYTATANSLFVIETSTAKAKVSSNEQII